MEYYATNMYDKDGILSASTTAKTHPVGSDSLRAIIENEGEIPVMEYFQKIGKEHRKEYFDFYLKKTFNRFVNVFIFTKYDMDLVPVKNSNAFY
jgi:hypothetical protein